MNENGNCGSASYLFACFGGDLICSPETVFGRINDDSLVPSLISILEKEYGGEGNPSFNAQPMTDTEEADQILLDEAIDELAIYDDPDPGVYDPPPSRQTTLRALYAQRAARWAETLRSRKARASTASKTNSSPLSDEVLLQMCRTSTDDERATAAWMADLQAMASLVDTSRNSRRIGLKHAVTLLAGCIGQLPQYNPTHLPFGYGGPTIKSHHWMDRDALEQVAKQIVGLIWHDVDPDVVASDVTRFVSEAIRLGFMEQQEYDAWRPGMRSGSGWRSAVTATSYGITKARACSEATPPPETKNGHRAARPGSRNPGRPDVANGWTFEPLDEGEVRASNQKLCGDYSALDEHDLLAISAKWRQMANKFTEAAKRTGHYHGHIVHEDEVLRVTKILETAVSHREIEGVNRLGRCLRRPDDGHLHWALATLDELDAKLRAEASTKKTEKPEDKDSAQTPVRQLAAALQELRLAAGELLHRSENVDIYPEPEVKTYHKALSDAEPRVDGISAHLAYGLEKPGQIETDIRETLHKLSKEMEHVTSDYNDRPVAYPLPKETTAPGWEAMKSLMPLEMVLAMTTMKPGDLEMPVEDRRVSGLILLMLLAQAYYKMLECVISMASWCSALDVELNESYLWVTSNLVNLLKSHDDLKDFPVEFKPIFDDLYPSTVRDVDWDDMVAPEAERFLSTVQRYVHEKGVYDPEEGSTACKFVQLFRPSVETAISRALDYHKRMHQYAQKAFGGISAGGSIQAVGAINAAGEIKAGGEITDGGDIRAGSPPATPSTKPSGTTVAADSISSKDSKYEWARQAELVRSTNQVLGQGELSKGVLSRACSGRLIETNGKSGQGSRVKVSSFLPWVTRKFSLAREEQTQIRNAIIGEINERNS
ncbi:MAG: hypothetical protein ACOC8H_00235 [bacterium]